MIRSFRHKGLKQYFEEGKAKGIAPEMIDRLRVRLDTLDAAVDASEMNISGWMLHELKGGHKGTWAIKVTGNYRLTFRFEIGNAYDVDLEDYH